MFMGILTGIAQTNGKTNNILGSADETYSVVFLNEAIQA